MIQGSKVRDNILFIVFTLLIYLPASTLGNLVRIAALAAAFMLLPADNSNPESKSLMGIAVCMLLSPLLSGLVVYLNESAFNTNLFIHEAVRMVFCALFLVTVSRMRVDFRIVYTGAVIALVPNFIIQVFQYRGNSAVYFWLQNHYVIGEEESIHLMLSLEEGIAFRAGSVFLNPNVYMVIPLICLCVFLQRDSLKKSLLNNLLIMTAIASCILTGSRTAAVTAMVILAFYYFKYASGQSIAMFVLIAAALTAFYGLRFLTESRSMQLGNDSMSSLEVKMNSYLWFWQATSAMPIYWLTGTIGAMIPIAMDSEWGHIYAWYGLFGICWYLYYYRTVFLHNLRVSGFFRIAAVICALVSFTASVMQCMPIFSFVAAVILSQITIKSTKVESVPAEAA